MYSYKRILGSITLLSYITIFTLNVFHYHNLDFNNSSSIDFKQAPEFLSKNSFSESGCIVLQNFYSLHNLIFSNSISTLPTDNGNQRLLMGINYNDFNNFHLLTNHLRAPPLST